MPAFRPILTERDIEHCREVAEELARGMNPAGGDSSELVMTSIGYVDVWYDGDVVFNGIIIANVLE